MIRTIKPIDKFVGKQIKITKVLINHGIYKSLSPGSIHKIIPMPGITPNSIKGIWIHYDNEIIYLVRKEYEFYFKPN